MFSPKLSPLLCRASEVYQANTAWRNIHTGSGVHSMNYEGAGHPCTGRPQNVLPGNSPGLMTEMPNRPAPLKSLILSVTMTVHPAPAGWSGRRTVQNYESG